MALKKKPVTGMKDILPKEMEIRNYVMNMIREDRKSTRLNSSHNRESRMPASA